MPNTTTRGGGFYFDGADFYAAAIAFGPAFTLEAGLIIERVLDQAGEVVQRRVKDRARRHRRSGSLERGIKLEGAGAGFDHAVRVRSSGPLAHLIVGGTDPHEIRPIEKRALSFAGAARPFGAAQHPGTRGDPYFRDGVRASIGDVGGILRDGGRELARELKRMSSTGG